MSNQIDVCIEPVTVQRIPTEGVSALKLFPLYLPHPLHRWYTTPTVGPNCCQQVRACLLCERAPLWFIRENRHKAHFSSEMSYFPHQIKLWQSESYETKIWLSSQKKWGRWIETVLQLHSVLTIVVYKHGSIWEVHRDKVGNQSGWSSISGFELCYKAALLKKEPWLESDLTLCSPRQSSKAVSWCRLNSVEFNNRWIPKRSLCITRYKRGRNDTHLSTVCCNSMSDSHFTSAVGKRGTENCSKPWIWICMVVSERWQTVRDCGKK